MNDFSKTVAKAVASFKSVKAKFDVLTQGVYNVVITKMRIMHSFQKADGSPKDGPFEWKTPTPLVALTFADEKGSVVMERYHLMGYKRYAELTPKQKESGKYTASERDGFALKDGDRIEDPTKTEACIEILSRVFTAIGLPEDSDLDDLQKMIDARTGQLQIEVAQNDPEDIKKGVYVKKVRALPVEADVTDEFN